MQSLEHELDAAGDSSRRLANVQPRDRPAQLRDLIHQPLVGAGGNAVPHLGTRPALETLARSLDLGNRVRFLGRISEAEKLSLLRRSWALLFASPKEGWGITNLEAAACATPVVASNSPGIRESVRDGETGYLVPHGDTTAMAAAMTRLAEDASLVEKLGAQARVFSTGFTWERAALETEQHLLKVIGA